MEKKNKLFVLCESLTAWEWNGLEKFIQSPYFNENEDLTRFFYYLKKEYKLKEGQVSKEKAWGTVFKTKKYKDARMRHLMSDFMALVEEFLVVQRIRKNKYAFNTHLLEIYEEKSLKKHFNHRLTVQQKLIEEGEKKDANHFFQRFVLAQRLYMHLVASDRRETTDSLQNAVDNLEIFYLANKLKLCCAMLNSQNILEVEHSIILFEEIIAHLEKSALKEIPVLAIYYAIIKTITDGDETYFEKLHSLLDKYWTRFSRSEAHDIHVYLLNYGIRKINQGRPVFLRKTFDVFKLMIDKQILVRNEFLSPWTFKNIVVLAMRLGEESWVAHFIEEYRYKIAPQYRENAYTYNFAKYNFYAGNYDKVLDLLQKVEYDDIFYSLDSKAMLLKTYYELGETEVLYSLMDSFRIFLRRKKGISAKHRQNFSNLIRFTRKASRIVKGQENKAKKLLLEVEETEGVADVAWLLAKVKELAITKPD